MIPIKESLYEKLYYKICNVKKSEARGAVY